MPKLNKDWATLAVIEDPEGGSWARLEQCPDPTPQAVAEGNPQDGHWQLAPATTAQANSQGTIKIANPWCNQRVVTSNENACAFAMLARSPANTQERELANWMADSGLWRRSEYGLAAPAAQAKERWSIEEAHFWASAMREEWGTLARGRQWLGAQPGPLPTRPTPNNAQRTVSSYSQR